MTDLPDAAADRAADESTPDGETPAGDPELAALVGTTPGSDARSRRGWHRARRRYDDPRLDLAPSEPTDTAPADTSPTSEPASMPCRSCPSRPP